MPEFMDATCPARGPGLTHTRDISKRADGACIHCGTALTSMEEAKPPVDEARTHEALPAGWPTDRLNRMWDRSENVPGIYSAWARQHDIAARKAWRSQRPSLERQHSHAAGMLMRALHADLTNPPVDLLGGDA